jgi:uncharacterized oligopeptide transporter (OPT) family protein
LRSLLRGQSAHRTPQDDIETPTSWFFAGQAFSLIGLAWLAKVTLGMPIWQTVVAVGLSFFLALVACRVTGETDTTPIGPMGKVTQLVFGGLNPGNMNVNLMSANITSSAAASSADLLTDLKSGYLLGANPRRQFIAQFAGIFIGTLASVLAFRVLVPTASVLGSEQFPAPAAQAWRAVAIVLSHGLETLGAVKIWSIIIGAAAGVLLTLSPLWFPKQAKWIPSAAGVGLAWTFPWQYGLLFFIGGVIGWAVERAKPAVAEVYNYPAAAGAVAGGSLMGVLLIFWQNLPAMLHQLLK